MVRGSGLWISATVHGLAGVALMAYGLTDPAIEAPIELVSTNVSIEPSREPPPPLQTRALEIQTPALERESEPPLQDAFRLPILREPELPVPCAVSRTIPDLEAQPRPSASPEIRVPVDETQARTAPQPRFNPVPDYPWKARRRGWEGRVVVRVFVSELGACRDVSITQSSEYDLLDEAAVQAVREWKFEPATRYGRPCAGTLELTFDFRLESR